MSGLLYFLVLLVTSLLDGIVECVYLQPHGVEYVCPGDNVSRTLNCSVSAQSIKWGVSGGEISLQSIQLVRGGKETGEITTFSVTVALISSTSSSLLSRLVTSNRPDLLPLTVQCNGEVTDVTTEFYFLKYKEQPDPPTNIMLMKNEGTATSCTIIWQSSSSGSRSADNYTVTITDSSSLTQTFTTSTSTLSVDLSHNTNITISVKATNCAGDSAENSITIGEDEEGSAMDSPTTISPTTISPSAGSTHEATLPTSAHMSSEQPATQPTTQPPSSTPGRSQPVDTSSSLPHISNSQNPFLQGQTLIWILVAVVGVVALSTLVIIAVVLLVCHRRRGHLKSVSMETTSESTSQSANADPDNIYNKLKAYSDFEGSGQQQQKHFHNPNYAELNMSPTDKVDQFTHTDHIYHVLEGPDPNAGANDQDYAEVSGCSGHSYSENHPDKHSATPPLEMKQRKLDDSPSAVQIKCHFPSSNDYKTQTWNFSYH